MKKPLILFTLFVLFASTAFVCIRFYSFVFSKTVVGEILRVEKVSAADSVITTGRNVPAEQLFSFAISIKDSRGEIHTASSEDRQWAISEAQQCVEAKFFPYPPWDLASAGTYFGARLIRLFDCEGAAAKKETHED